MHTDLILDALFAHPPAEFRKFVVFLQWLSISVFMNIDSALLKEVYFS